VIAYYLNQTASLKVRTGHDGYDPVYANPVTIAVRWESKRSLVRNTQGEQVVSEAKVFTEASINPSDVLTYGGRDWPVITVSDVTDLDGNVSHREVYV